MDGCGATKMRPYVNVEDLEIYKKAEELADEIWREVVSWDYFARNTVGKQLVDAADSVGANIAEGEGRHHIKDAVYFLYVSRGSLKETQYWLRRARRRKLMKNATADTLSQKAQTLLKQLNAYVTGKKRIRHQSINP